MDETDQQNESETVPKCTDGDSLKGSVNDDNEDVRHSSPKKISVNASSSENSDETFSANGTEKETNESDTQEEPTETLASEVQEEKSTEYQLEKTNKELSGISDDIENCLKEICEGVDTSEENNSNLILNDNSNLSKNSNCTEKNEDCENEIGKIINEINDNAVDSNQCNKPDLNENKESSCHIVENIETETISNIEKETNDTLKEQSSIKEIASILFDVEEPAHRKESREKDDKLLLELSNQSEAHEKDTSNVLESDLYKVSELIENSSESETNQSVDVQDKAVVGSNVENEEENLIQFSPLKSADVQNKLDTVSLSEIKEKNSESLVAQDEGEKNDTTVVTTNVESDAGETVPQGEAKEDSTDTQNKSDSIEDPIMNQANVSSNGEEQDEENKSKGENEGSELMDTEIVNCNEIDQVELNENESQKEKEIDRIQIESTESGSKDDSSYMEMLEDTLSGEDTEEAQKTQADEMLGKEISNNVPGSNAEETITGYKTNLKDKNEENCILPGGNLLKLADLQQIARETKKSKGENEILKSGKIATVEKPKTRAQDKKSETGDAAKPRPIRSAAKLAENKIRSLVANDMVFEEGTSAKEFEDQPVEEEEDEEDEDQVNDEESTECSQCGQVKTCKLITFQDIGSYYICSDACIAAFKIFHTDKEPTDSEKMALTCNRKCSQCNADIIIRNHRRLFWETMDFCDEDCLARYQHRLGSHCVNCNGMVGSTSIGKYCVRFGFDIKQFCSGGCLEEYKKGLKFCSYCQKDISTGVEGFLAPVGSKNKFKDFCSQSCMEKYELMSSTVPLPEIIEECAVCSNKKPVQVQVELDEKTHKLCSEPCFAAFKFVNNITEGQCEMCRKYYDCSKTPKHVVRINFYDEAFHAFCSKTCLNVYVLANRTIVPCNWCKIKKYDFDMIKQINSIGQLIMMCSITCLMSYRMSVKPSYLPRIRCGFCIKNRKPLYYLTMTDSSTRYFCNSTCVLAFQNCYKKKGYEMVRGGGNVPKPVGSPKRMVHQKVPQESTCIPIISSVQSLASNSPAIPATKVSLPRPEQGAQTSQQLTISPPAASMSIPPLTPPPIRQQIIVKPPETKEMKNKSVLCKPYSHTKGVSCRPHPCMKETQTDQSLNRKFLIPIPIPIYVPAPMHMFATPFPVPVPFPLPVPVPIFIPTTRNSAKGIMKEIKKIQEKIPTDPFEAELLMMAEMVAGDKKHELTDSDSEDGNEQEEKADGTFYTENVDTSNTFGDDMLQMALKMASELEEPAVDMESVLTSSTITTNTQPDPSKALYASDDPDQVNVMGMNRGRKRSVRGARNSAGGTPNKRGRRTSGSDVPLLPPPDPVPSRTLEVEKPDANMCLKYTFGVNAWRHWVMQKNAELEKAALTNRKIKLFKPDLLQLTADELNFSLCLFVKEVRKPNGTEYAPDTIYYLCLGIQQYLFENGRIDNIFTDSYYEKFTDCLDEVAKKFEALYNDSQYIVTRVEEEHLWESKQLGAHSPHVLLSTLMFFNTKHFNLVTVEEHMQLSFSHIMKHWKRNPNTPGVAKAPGSRNVLLRFYPPQSALEANSRKKKVYEQQENEENPLRCPVKLYEFYLSKCPESVKTRNDVFYLLPERSCVPDSPVWYSTMALGKEPLMKMLHRVKMVKEINIALLTS